MISLKRISSFLLIAVFSFSLFSMLDNTKSEAVTASDWKPGRIIDDAVFFNKDAMSPAQIQQFLNSKVPVCNTYYNWSGWYKGYWNAPPWTCIKDYQENGKSAAQIIWEAGQRHGINPQVLIITLQKETAIITDTWAAPWQYKRATGYLCPDSKLGTDVDANQNGCYDSHESFTAQINGAAWQLKRYTQFPDSFNFKAGVTRNIRWSPNSTCGSSPVYIETQGTAALYNYTPYQPNAAALNNLYGTGDNCSTYGNRNFWRMFNDWFGASTVPNGNIKISAFISPNSTSPRVMDKLTLSYSVKNNGAYATDTGVLWICGNINGKVFGGGSNRKVLAPGETLVVSMPYTPSEPGTLTLTACGDIPGGPGWTANYPYADWMDHRVRSYRVETTSIVVNSFISPINQKMHIGGVNRLFYSVTNRDTISKDTGVLWICGNINGKVFSGGSNRKVLAPGETLVVSMPYTPSEPGTLTLTACGDIPGGPGWTANYPYADWMDHRVRSYRVETSPLKISAFISPNSTSPRVMDKLTLSYSVKNNGAYATDTGVLWICGNINGKVFGGGSNRKVLAPGETLVVSMPYTPSEPGTLTLTACGDIPGGPGWTANYPYADWMDHRVRSYRVETTI